MHIFVRIRRFFFLTCDTIVILYSDYSNFCANKEIFEIRKRSRLRTLYIILFSQKFK